MNGLCFGHVRESGALSMDWQASIRKRLSYWGRLLTLST